MIVRVVKVAFLMSFYFSQSSATDSSQPKYTCEFALKNLSAINLVTERLALRTVRQEDLPEIKNLFLDDRIHKFLVYGKLTAEEELTWSMEASARSEGAYVLISDKSTDKVIGVLVFWQIPPQEIGRNDKKVYARYGIAVSPEVRGRWITHEATRAIFTDLIRNRGVDFMIGRVHPTNPWSFKVAERAGLKKFEVITDPDWFYYSYPAFPEMQP